jgi:hypothetical protein
VRRRRNRAAVGRSEAEFEDFRSDEFIRTNLVGSAHDYWYWASIWVSSTREIVRSPATIDQEAKKC